MRNDRWDPRYSLSRKLALRWLRLRDHTRERLGESIGGVHRTPITRYLSLKEPQYKPTSRRDAMVAILEGILRVCQIADVEGLPIDLELKARLEAKFCRPCSPVEFLPLADEGREVLGLLAAKIVKRELGKLLDRRHGCPVFSNVGSGKRPRRTARGRRHGCPAFLNAGGPTILDAVDRLHWGALPWQSASVGALNVAQWPDEREVRGAVSIAQRLSQRLQAPFLSRSDLEAARQCPGVAILSGGGEYGFPHQWLCERGHRLPPGLPGDFNYHRLQPTGEEFDDPKIAKVLRALRYFEGLGDLQDYLKSKSVILTLSDARYDENRDNPPTGLGSSKAHLARACLQAGLANIVVLPSSLAERILVDRG